MVNLKIYQFRAIIPITKSSILRKKKKEFFGAVRSDFFDISSHFWLVRKAFSAILGYFNWKTTPFCLTGPIFNYFFGLRYHCETRLDGWLEPKVNVQFLHNLYIINYCQGSTWRPQKVQNFQKLHFLVVNRPSLDQSLVIRSVFCHRGCGNVPK